MSCVFALNVAGSCATDFTTSHAWLKSKVIRTASPTFPELFTSFTWFYTGTFLKIFVEIHVLGACIYLVTTRDVSNFASVTSDSFPAKFTSVLFWSKQCELCKFCLTQCGVEQLLLSTACTVRELSGTPGACCFFLVVSSSW